MITVPGWLFAALIIISTILMFVVVVEDVRRREATKHDAYVTNWVTQHHRGTDYHIDPDDYTGIDR